MKEIEYEELDLKSDNNKDVNMIMTIIIGVLIILDIVGMTIMR